MRILLVSTQDYIHHPVPSRHHYIFEELAKKHEVHVPHFHVSDGRARETRLIVHEATKINIKNPAPHYFLNSPYHFRVIDEIIDKEKIEIVVASHILAGYAAVKAGKKYSIPVIFDLKDWYPDSAAIYYDSKIFKRVVYNSVLKILLKNLYLSDVITTVSPSLAKVLKSYGFTSVLITNGVDTEVFRPYKKSVGIKKLGLMGDEFVIGYVGSLENWLDFESVLKGLRLLVSENLSVRLAIIGRQLFTDYEEKMFKTIQTLGIGDYVKFYGFVPYSELPQYIAGMDVCLIPFKISPVSEVALPNKFFEYTACGKNILSTPLPDLIKINPGNILFYSNYNEFVDKIRLLYDRTGISHSRKLTRKLRLENYDWKRKAKDFEDLMNKLTNH
ncbi:glycosyltransferase WbuB [Archaeoglobales archaeon]|nr:MAG: glycosyltransferase WbuB [Archaeoglobales archaeon]